MRAHHPQYRKVLEIIRNTAIVRGRFRFLRNREDARDAVREALLLSATPRRTLR